MIPGNSFWTHFHRRKFTGSRGVRHNVMCKIWVRSWLPGHKFTGMPIFGSTRLSATFPPILNNSSNILVIAQNSGTSMLITDGEYIRLTIFFTHCAYKKVQFVLNDIYMHDRKRHTLRFCLIKFRYIIESRTELWNTEIFRNFSVFHSSVELSWTHGVAGFHKVLLIITMSLVLIDGALVVRLVKCHCQF